MIRIRHFNCEPFHSMSYMTANRRGKHPMCEQLMFYHAEAEGLPSDIKSLIVTSDLQGRELGNSNRLIGCALADELDELRKQRIIQKPSLALVCGDLYEYPDCRKPGGTGLVDEVFRSLGKVCDQVIGVLGNHDQVETSSSSLGSNVTILDGASKSVQGLRIAGISGIIGDPIKNLRRSQDLFLKNLRALAAKSPNVILLHQGPDDPESNRKGSNSVRLALEAGYSGLTIFGHTRWDGPPIVRLGNGQGLNAHGRVIVVAAT